MKAIAADVPVLREIWWQARESIPLTTVAPEEQQIAWWREWVTYQHAWKLIVADEIEALMLIHGDEIRYIVVRARYRGKRAAARLLRFAQRRVLRRGRGCLLAKTKEINSPMKAALQRAQFHLTARDSEDWCHYEWRV